VSSLGYTPTAALGSAERWPVQIVERLLPRHSRSSTINRRHLRACARGTGRRGTRAAHEHSRKGTDPHGAHGHLAVVESHAVNGVAALHTDC